MLSAVLSIFSLFVVDPIFATTQCQFNSDCAPQMVCLSDMNGRGQCLPKGEAVGVGVSGKVGESCAFPSDCLDGLICSRPHGYLSSGVCALDTNRERPQ